MEAAELEKAKFTSCAAITGFPQALPFSVRRGSARPPGSPALAWLLNEICDIIQKKTSGNEAKVFRRMEAA